MTTIPNPPSLGDTFTNENTGVSYSYDGSKWVVTSTPTDRDLSELAWIVTGKPVEYNKN